MRYVTIEYIIRHWIGLDWIGLMSFTLTPRLCGDMQATTTKIVPVHLHGLSLSYMNDLHASLRPMLFPWARSPTSVIQIVGMLLQIRELLSKRLG